MILCIIVFMAVFSALGLMLDQAQKLDERDKRSKKILITKSERRTK